eukprot:TRINITY_DN12266_c0_g1_i1.p1 TRINITY_DN12266_c0_g1~~TRINITY_DN12266_c0_g1_i1.p1  ORF type:complete len:217 (-),score=30.58 TRINITY_DN12266_c0_g1_i1:101-751(-)
MNLKIVATIVVVILYFLLSRTSYPCVPNIPTRVSDVLIDFPAQYHLNPSVGSILDGDALLASVVPDYSSFLYLSETYVFLYQWQNEVYTYARMKRLWWSFPSLASIKVEFCEEVSSEYMIVWENLGFDGSFFIEKDGKKLIEIKRRGFWNGDVEFQLVDLIDNDRVGEVERAYNDFGELFIKVKGLKGTVPNFLIATALKVDFELAHYDEDEDELL